MHNLTTPHLNTVSCVHPHKVVKDPAITIWPSHTSLHLLPPYSLQQSPHSVVRTSQTRILSLPEPERYNLPTQSHSPPFLRVWKPKPCAVFCRSPGIESNCSVAISDRGPQSLQQVPRLPRGTWLQCDVVSKLSAWFNGMAIWMSRRFIYSPLNSVKQTWIIFLRILKYTSLLCVYMICLRSFGNKCILEYLAL